jgi:hypothetical protein
MSAEQVRKYCFGVGCRRKFELSYLPAANTEKEAENIRLLLLLQFLDVLEGTHLRVEKLALLESQKLRGARRKFTGLAILNLPNFVGNCVIADSGWQAFGFLDRALESTDLDCEDGCR